MHLSVLVKDWRRGRALPSPVRCSVMSVSQSWFGPAAVNLCLTRPFSGHRAEIVVDRRAVRAAGAARFYRGDLGY